MRRNLLLLIVLAYLPSMAQINPHPDHDTTYYRSFKGAIIVRAFLSRKYMVLKMDPPGNIPDMGYHAHTPLSFGLGLTYRSLSVSLSKGLNFLQSNEKKGETHSTDLQVHLYKRKWTIDAFAEFYQGGYLTPHGLGSADGQSYYTRPDLGESLVGLSVYRVLNDKRFCYGAGLSQNAWQQRSAGSFLVGGEAFYIANHADSGFAPSLVDPVYNQENLHKVHLFEIGPGIGYAYTLVLQKHYFLLGSVNANINLGYSREVGNGIGAGRFSLTPNYLVRLGGGYNTNTWGLSLLWITTGVRTEGEATDYRYVVNTGSYRLVYARRIAIGKKMKNIVGPSL
jgi:hypothetical protein